MLYRSTVFALLAYTMPGKVCRFLPKLFPLMKFLFPADIAYSDKVPDDIANKEV